MSSLSVFANRIFKICYKTFIILLNSDLNEIIDLVTKFRSNPSVCRMCLVSRRGVTQKFWFALTIDTQELSKYVYSDIFVLYLYGQLTDIIYTSNNSIGTYLWIKNITKLVSKTTYHILYYF